MFLLYGPNGVRGSYDSEDALTKSVDYWMRASPEETLLYELWESNSNEGTYLEWEWCYIPPSANLAVLMDCGHVPRKEFWGRNITFQKWETE